MGRINISMSAMVAVLIFILNSLCLAAPSAKAIFAAGCFWCAEHDFAKVDGVTDVISGYTGGGVKNPSYEQVGKGDTGHFEAIEVTYNPEKISYAQLLDIFWHNVDPTDAQGQFCDKGSPYRSAIFYQTKEEQQLAEASKAALLRAGRIKKVATLILPAKPFYPAEAYHQDYAEKNPVRYRYYRYTCGRDQRLEQLWRK